MHCYSEKPLRSWYDLKQIIQNTLWFNVTEKQKFYFEILGMKEILVGYRGVSGKHMEEIQARVRRGCRRGH